MAEAEYIVLHPRTKDLTGQRFGKWSVLGAMGRDTHGRVIWECVCDCGNIKNVASSNLVQGSSQSCGCVTISRMTTHGMCKTPEHTSWNNMIDRCHNENSHAYKDYGARGITVCDTWRSSFEQFFIDMGKRPTKLHTLERIDNELGYYPENCRWATRAEQARNKRNNVLFTLNGETKCLRDWEYHFGAKKGSFSSRLARGWSIARTVTTPLAPHERPLELNGVTLNLTQWAKKLGVTKSFLSNRINRGWSVERTLTTPVRVYASVK